MVARAVSTPSGGDLHGLLALGALLNVSEDALLAAAGERFGGELSPELAEALVEGVGLGISRTGPRGGGRGGMDLPRRGVALLEILRESGGAGPRFWVAVRPGPLGREFFDPSACGGRARWMTTAQWKAQAMPRHLRAPGRVGMSCAVGIEVGPPKLRLAPTAEEDGAPPDPMDIPLKGPQHDPRAIAALMAQLDACLKGHRIHLAAPPDPEEADVGPRWVRAYLKLKQGQSIRAIRNLSEDIARSLGTLTSDIHIANLPERHAVGIDLPIRSLGYALSYDDLLGHPSFNAARETLTLGIPAGVDVTGRPVWVDLAEMPHMLVAGTTGSGKTVFLRSILLTLALQHPPEALEILLSSSKPMDFRPFAGLPHALEDIAQTPEEALELVGDLVEEMNRRIRFIDKEGQDDLGGYNAAVPAKQRVPRLVCVLDEYGDTVMSFSEPSERRHFETCVARLAQKARAAGIHLVLCMQRPDRRVIKGIIKTNILHRFALKLPQHHDSRIILDEAGAEALLGQGDLLYKDGAGRLQRLQVPFLEGGDALRARVRGMGADGD